MTSWYSGLVMFSLARVELVTSRLLRIGARILESMLMARV